MTEVTALHNGTSLTPNGLPAEASMNLSPGMDSIATPDDEFNGPCLKKRKFSNEECSLDGLDVRTLFVSGLPMDAKPRELYLLFRAYKGYSSSLLKITAKQPPKLQHLPNCGYEGSLLKVTGKNGKSTSPVGFVTFSSRAEAEIAKQDLQQGVRFDPDLPQTLRLEFAKSNTKVTKPKQQSPQPAATHPTFIHPLTGRHPAGPEAWAAAAHPALQGTFPDLNLMAHQPPTLIQHPALAQVPIQPPLTMASIAGGHQTHPALAHPAAAIPTPHLAASPVLGSPVPGQTQPSVTVSSASCMAPGTAAHNNTLFVTNLGPFCSEQELKDLFSSFPGFLRMRMHNKAGAPVAFVEYRDVRTATDAMTRLQGFILLSSERGGIRIEYASKAKLGEPTAQVIEGSILIPQF